MNVTNDFSQPQRYPFMQKVNATTIQSIEYVFRYSFAASITDSSFEKILVSTCGQIHEIAHITIQNRAVISIPNLTADTALSFLFAPIF